MKNVQVSAIAVVIFAHGGEHDWIKFSDGNQMTLRKLLQPLMLCEKLNGKPKIIITQCSRGSNHSSQERDSDSNNEIRLNNKVSKLSLIRYNSN